MTEPLVFRTADGAVTLTASALNGVAARAAESVEGVRLRRPRRAVEVGHGDGRASVSLELGARHGVPLPALARSVQERVAEAVAAVTGLEVERVDVEIAEVS